MTNNTDVWFFKTQSSAYEIKSVASEIYINHLICIETVDLLLESICAIYRTYITVNDIIYFIKTVSDIIIKMIVHTLHFIISTATCWIYKLILEIIRAASAVLATGKVLRAVLYNYFIVRGWQRNPDHFRAVIIGIIPCINIFVKCKQILLSV